MRWIVVSAACLLACGSSEPDGCASPADCAEGELCINGACVLRGSDAGNDTGTDAGSDTGTDTGADVLEDAPTDTPTDVLDAGPVLACPGPGGERDDPIVLYTFQAPDDAASVSDRAPAAPDVPLTDNTGAFELFNAGAGSVTMSGGRLSATQPDSDALVQELLAAGSFTVEVWAQTRDLIQEEESGPERIVTLSENSGARAFTVGHDEGDLVTRLRTSTTRTAAISCDEMVDGDARPPLAEQRSVGAFDALSPKHIVMVFDQDLGEPQIYVNGTLSDDPWRCRRGVLNWESELVHKLALGDENDAIRTWEGDIHRVAIYARPMSAAEVGCWFTLGHTAELFTR